MSDELLERAFAAAVQWGTENIDTPQFDEAGRMHDWRNYVPDEMRTLWSTLDRQARIAVFLTAKSRADSERWE